VISYCGPLTKDIVDTVPVLKTLPDKHCIKLSIVNSGSNNVSARIQNQTFVCSPGVTELKFELHKKFDQSLQFDMQFTFDSEYQPQWDQYDSGDYYSKNGLYINHIQVDHRDITLWGFNQITQQMVLSSVEFPGDYHLHKNHRCVITDTVLSWQVPGNIGLQAWLLKELHPDDYQERVYVDQKLYNEINWYDRS
jgi:hypothetical protein